MVVNGRIGGRCAVVISCWDFLILLGMVRPLRAAYPFILSIKPGFRTCALHRYRCRQEGGSSEAIQWSVFLMLFGMVRICAAYPVMIQINRADIHLGSMRRRRSMGVVECAKAMGRRKFSFFTNLLMVEQRITAAIGLRVTGGETKRKPPRQKVTQSHTEAGKIFSSTTRTLTTHDAQLTNITNGEDRSI